MPESVRDMWAEWLLKRRCGGDADELQRLLDYLYPVRDRILDNAKVAHGDVLLDVGTGDGLIAFGAIDRVGESGRVIFSDESQDLLDRDRQSVGTTGIGSGCQFIQASAENLSPFANKSIDVVTTRSVLIYVADKQRAFDEFSRVLRVGGRISLFEPINRFGYAEPPHVFWGFDVSPVQDVAAKVRALYHKLQPLDTDSMMDFDERDLLSFAERAGFAERHLELRVDVEPHDPRPWETFAHIAFNPRIPTLAEAMQTTLTATERTRLEAHLRPLVERGAGSMPLAVAYLWAEKR